MNKLRTKQGGSVASFIIVGVIILASLAGVIYFVNKRSEDARKEQQIASEKKEEAEKELAETESKTNTDKVKTPADEESEEVLNLPATGPEFSAIEMIGVYFLSTAFAAYLLSRKKLSHSL